MKHGQSFRVACLAFAGLSAAGCGGTSIAAAGTAGKSIKPVTIADLPAVVGGLAVKPEDDVDTLNRAGRTYVDRVSLFSLRQADGTQKDLVQATLQISHFNKAARVDSAKFRSAIVSQLGGATPSAIRIGNDTVFLTKGLRQSVSVWFRGKYLFILSTREDFDRPRALLRSALEVKT
jgi:hypothetical protein